MQYPFLHHLLTLSVAMSQARRGMAWVTKYSGSSADLKTHRLISRRRWPSEWSPAIGRTHWFRMSRIMLIRSVMEC